MITKKNFILGIILGIFLIGIVSGVGEVSYCCEKTTSGAWCQNAPEENCDKEYRKVPASCEATSYCKLGCCYDSQEGTCMENTPEIVCNSEGGVWEDNAECDIPQCELGCCLIGDQAAFVTQTRCKRLSALYGLETNFRTDITNEISCIASAMSDVKGACVYEEDYAKTCQFLTKKECSELSVGNETEFHEGFLCSSETLGTNCGPSKKTTCVEGRDEVYFVDTCGNLANIYDASKINSKEYWTNVYEKAESCNPSSSNADSVSCGNCDYYLGSTCKNYKSAGKKATYGDNICKDLSCKYDGKTHQHGETWCANSNGIDKSLPGSRHFRLVCYNGEVSVEPCADFRQETCIESEINGFKTAACRVNMWQDCVAQDNKKDCENIDRRDCKWIGDRCVPLYAPGFNFWETEGDAEELCSLANKECIIKYEKKLTGSKKCVENCHCENENAWKDSMNNFCISIGDCGEKTNYLGFQGYN
ncbi:hypothetical protein KAT80_03165 [Candidatus Pacearchaeota archaeon]|nr:hypothetical protein [Candidatus Pacearchaeota archaeon]